MVSQKNKGRGLKTQVRRGEVDWQRLVLNLRCYMPCRRIDRKLSRHFDYAAKLARGEIAEPGFADGVNLLNLHLDVCGKAKHRGLLRG